MDMMTIQVSATILQDIAIVYICHKNVGMIGTKM